MLSFSNYLQQGLWLNVQQGLKQVSFGVEQTTNFLNFQRREQTVRSNQGCNKGSNVNLQGNSNETFGC